MPKLNVLNVTVTESPGVIAQGPGRFTLYTPNGLSFFLGIDASLTMENGYQFNGGSFPVEVDLLAGDELWIMSSLGQGSVPISYRQQDVPGSGHYYEILAYGGQSGTAEVFDLEGAGIRSSIMFYIHAAAGFGTKLTLELHVVDAINVTSKLLCSWPNIYDPAISSNYVIAICDPGVSQADYGPEVYVKQVRVPASFKLLIVPSDGNPYDVGIVALTTG